MSEPGEEGEAAAQPTQPVFRSELAGASRPLVSPDSFSGLSNWAEWIDHFEAAALVNGWDSEKKRLWLPVRLTGKAQTAWKRLSPETKQNYEAAKEALQKRFEPDSKRKLYFVEFQARRRKRDESWSDFADELRVLAEKALPELDEKAKELLALERYLGELDNHQVAFAVRQREPKTVDEAVTATLEIQSYLRPGVRQEVNAATVAEESRGPEYCCYVVNQQRPGHGLRNAENIVSTAGEAGIFLRRCGCDSETNADDWHWS
eukprot:Em0004g1247a